MADVASICRAARKAARRLAPADRSTREGLLQATAASLRARTPEVLAANAQDLEQARAGGMSAAMLDRLALDARRVAAIADAVDEVSRLPDPLGRLLYESVRPNGVRVRRVSVPIGVIAMIYESRPNVTADASALCLKAGNAVVLRGGSEAARSNAAIHASFVEALGKYGLPAEAVQMLPPGDRDAIRELVQQTETVDLVIPRGGEGLVRFVQTHARVPVIAHAKGVCHHFVDAGADVEMATRLAVNGKLQRPGVCNALECLLVDEADAARLLPPIARALLDGGCELHGCERTVHLVAAAKPASDEDWGKEFGDRIMAVRVVAGLDGALDHVARFGSGHTEAICTRDASHAERWRHEVDASCVAVNASTRLHDGGELGLGAEIGTATSKLHWRGAMGLEGLTTFQWVLDGDGQVRP